MPPQTRASSRLQCGLTGLVALLSPLVLGIPVCAEPPAIPAGPPSAPLAPQPLWPDLSSVLGLPAWMTLDLSLSAEPMGGSAPGVGSSGAWIQQLALTAEFGRGLARDKANWRELDHWKVAMQLTSFSGNANLNQTLGTAFPLQTAAHPMGLWPTEATLQRMAGGEALFVKGGLMALNPAFVEAEVLNSYIHSAFNNTLNLTINGLPINPLMAPAATVHLRLGKSSEVRLGQFWLDNVNLLAGLFGVNPQLPQTTGSLQILQWNVEDLPGTASLQQPLLWRGRTVARQLPAPMLQVGGFNTTGPGSNQGIYGNLTMAPSLPLGLDHRVWLGFNNGFNPQNNPNPSFLAGGWLVQGLLPGRPLDVLALAFGSTSFSPSLNPGLNPESVLELNYAIPISSQLTLQPVLQWIVQPGGNNNRAAVIAAGIQININF